MASPSRKKRLLLGFVVVPLVAALGLEVGARLVDRVHGRRWSADEARKQIEETRHVLSRRAFLPGARPEDDAPGEPEGTSILQPYTGWTHLITQKIVADELDYYTGDEARAAYDVCVLGGSVAQQFGVLGAQRLIDDLRRDPRFKDREVRVHDFARAAFKQPQPTMELAYLLALGHAPDLVIELDGFNEAAIGWANAKGGFHPLYPYYATWSNVSKGMRYDPETGELFHELHVTQDRAHAYADKLLGSGLWRSCFLAHVGRSRLEALRGEYVEAYKKLVDKLQHLPKDPETQGPRFDARDEAVVFGIGAAWEDGARTMDAICAAHRIDFLHVFQPAVDDAGSKPLTAKEIAGAASNGDWTEGVKRVYPELRERSKKLVAAGIPFLDATGVFREHPEEIYSDGCHFGERGNEILADAIAAAVLKLAPRK